MREWIEVLEKEIIGIVVGGFCQCRQVIPFQRPFIPF